nr:MAG TPA: hypothetical protein [Caudoviricetes sp.]
MKTLVFLGTGRYAKTPVLVDYANNTIESYERTRSAIDDIYVAKEDILVGYKKNGKDVTVKANKGDIIVTFYNEDFIEYPVVVVKNADWKANMLSYFKKQEAEKAKNLVQAQFTDCESSCDSCRGC